MYLEEFFSIFQTGFKDEVMPVLIGSVNSTAKYAFDEIPYDAIANAEKLNIYFTPAVHRKGTTNLKKPSVLGSKVVWAEVDKIDLIKPVVKPSLIIRSGRGYHMYWILREAERWTKNKLGIEQVNKILGNAIPYADKKVWDITRKLRVPFSTNIKPGREPLTVEIIEDNRHLVYTLAELYCVGRIQEDNKLVQMIQFDNHLYLKDNKEEKDRSRRDFAIMARLIEYGASDNIIRNIFLDTELPVHEKMLSHGDPEHYFNTTLEKAKIAVAKGKKYLNAQLQPGSSELISGHGISQKGGIYWRHTKNGETKISNFYIKPIAILAPVERPTGEEKVTQYFVGDLVSTYGKKETIIFEPDNFRNLTSLVNKISSFEYNFMGSDADVRNLKNLLHTIFVEKGLTVKHYSKKSGLFFYGNKWVYLLGDEVLTEEGLVNALDFGLTWKNEVALPIVFKKGTTTPDEKKEFFDTLMEVNDKHNVSAYVGWLTSAMLRPWLYKKGHKFPTLVLSGSRGSGKTTTIEQVICKIIPFESSAPKDADSSKFPIIPLSNQSNAFPIAFIEVVGESVLARFQSIVKTNYDVAVQYRGNPDQTLNKYTYTAPLILDGEDSPSDSAVKERSINLQFIQNKVKPGTDAYIAMNKLQQMDLNLFGSEFLQWITIKLNKDNGKYMEEMLSIAEEMVYTKYPEVSTRIVKNTVVVYFGLRLFCEFIGVEPFGVEILHEVVANVFHFHRGRADIDFDIFATDIVNFIAESKERVTIPFFYELEAEGRQVVFSARAYNWWATERKKLSKEPKQLEAILNQIADVTYAERVTVVRGRSDIKVDLLAMNSEGLNVPVKIVKASNYLKKDTQLA